MRRLATASYVLLVTLAACSSPQPDERATPTPPTATPTTATPTISTAQQIQVAEEAVEAELPDAPIWQGMQFDGSVIDDATICVDRTWGPEGGADGEGGSAGYVLVTFPQIKLGEPTDGVCSDVSEAPEEQPAQPVQVPDSLKNEPGLITRTDLGDEWPLIVDYGVIACENQEAGDVRLMIATFTGPDGTTYALNGTAKTHTDSSDIDIIWAADPNEDSLKINIGPLIDRALTFC